LAAAPPAYGPTCLHSTDEEKGTATMPASAASAEQPAKMMTLAEIQAHADAHVHLAANVPAGGKKLHKIDAAALADRANELAFAGISR
jgi:hypothetical protein